MSPATPAPNPHLEIEPVLAGAPLDHARLAGVLIHGRDQDEQVMLDVVARLQLADVAYVLPVAAGHSWYPGRYFDPLEANQPEVSWSLQAYQAAIAVATAAGLDDGQIVLAGFSQGGCLLAELAARTARRFAGVAVMTGTLLGPPGQEAKPGRVDGLPMFFSGSQNDDWVDVARVRSTARAFQAAGARVTLDTDDDPEHRINDRAVTGLRTLFNLR
jgi:predicted esterase